MAHIKLEEIYFLCSHVGMDEECDTSADWCRNPDAIYEGRRCDWCDSKTRFIECNRREFSAEEHDATYDGLHGCWDFTSVGKTRICSYLEIDGHVYCDVRGEGEEQQ